MDFDLVALLINSSSGAINESFSESFGTRPVVEVEVCFERGIFFTGVDWTKPSKLSIVRRGVVGETTRGFLVPPWRLFILGNRLGSENNRHALGQVDEVDFSGFLRSCFSVRLLLYISQMACSEILKKRGGLPIFLRGLKGGCQIFRNV